MKQSAVATDWKIVGKSLLAGVGALAVAGIGINLSIAAGMFVAGTTLFVGSIATSSAPLGISALSGMAVAVLGSASSLFGAVKLFKAAPNRWIAAAAVAGGLLVSSFIPEDAGAAEKMPPYSYQRITKDGDVVVKEERKGCFKVGQHEVCALSRVDAEVVRPSQSQSKQPLQTTGAVSPK